MRFVLLVGLGRSARRTGSSLSVHGAFDARLHSPVVRMGDASVPGSQVVPVCLQLRGI